MARFAKAVLGPLSALGGPATKASIGSSFDADLFGNIGGPSVKTDEFSFGDGVLSRTGGEFLNQSRDLTGKLEANRARFGTGFTDFTRSRLQDVENARARTVGNLRSQLGRRGILGASFAQDAIARTELDFVREADRVRAEAEVAEFQLDLENLKVQQQANQFQLTRQLKELELSFGFVEGINSAIIDRDKIEAFLEIERLKLSQTSSSVGLSGGGNKATIGGSSFGGGSTFQGSTGTTATSTPIITGASIDFGNPLFAKSDVNPGGLSSG